VVEGEGAAQVRRGRLDPGRLVGGQGHEAAVGHEPAALGHRGGGRGQQLAGGRGALGRPGPDLGRGAAGPGGRLPLGGQLPVGLGPASGQQLGRVQGGAGADPHQLGEVGGDLGPVEAGVAAEHVAGRLPEGQRHLLEPGGQAVEGVGGLLQVPAQAVGAFGLGPGRALQIGGHHQDPAGPQRVLLGLLAPAQQELLLGQDQGQLVPVGRLLLAGGGQGGQGLKMTAALGGPPAQPGGGEVVDPPLVGAQAEVTALGRERVQHCVKNGVERPSCRTCHVRSLSYTRHARRLRRAPRGPAKSGVNPALSRNCEAPPFPAGTSQVACLRGRKLSPRRKGGLCL
jgi:hypothetical protein